MGNMHKRCMRFEQQDSEENGLLERGWYVGGMCALSSPTLRPVKPAAVLSRPQPAATNYVSVS